MSASRPAAGRWCISSMVRNDPALVGPGRLAYLLEQTAQVAGQVARVGRPRDGLDVHEQGPTLGQGEGEGLEHPEGPPVHPLHLLLATQLEEGLAQSHRQSQREHAVVAHLDVLVDEAPLPGHSRELVEQSCLSHTVQAGDELALRTPADEQPLQGHVELPGLRGPSGELLGAGTRSRVVGVAHLVHAALYNAVSPL